MRRHHRRTNESTAVRSSGGLKPAVSGVLLLLEWLKRGLVVVESPLCEWKMSPKSATTDASAPKQLSRNYASAVIQASEYMPRHRHNAVYRGTRSPRIRFRGEVCPWNFKGYIMERQNRSSSRARGAAVSRKLFFFASLLYMLPTDPAVVIVRPARDAVSGSFLYLRSLPFSVLAASASEMPKRKSVRSPQARQDKEEADGEQNASAPGAGSAEQQRGNDELEGQTASSTDVDDTAQKGSVQEGDVQKSAPASQQKRRRGRARGYSGRTSKKRRAAAARREKRATLAALASEGTQEGNVWPSTSAAGAAEEQKPAAESERTYDGKETSVTSSTLHLPQMEGSPMKAYQALLQSYLERAARGESSATVATSSEHELPQASSRRVGAKAPERQSITPFPPRRREPVYSPTRLLFHRKRGYYRDHHGGTAASKSAKRSRTTSTLLLEHAGTGGEPSLPGGSGKDSSDDANSQSEEAGDSVKSVEESHSAQRRKPEGEQPKAGPRLTCAQVLFGHDYAMPARGPAREEQPAHNEVLDLSIRSEGRHPSAYSLHDTAPSSSHLTLGVGRVDPRQRPSVICRVARTSDPSVGETNKTSAMDIAGSSSSTSAYGSTSSVPGAAPAQGVRSVDQRAHSEHPLWAAQTSAQQEEETSEHLRENTQLTHVQRSLQQLCTLQERMCKLVFKQTLICGAVTDVLCSLASQVADAAQESQSQAAPLDLSSQAAFSRQSTSASSAESSAATGSLFAGRPSASSSAPSSQQYSASYFAAPRAEETTSGAAHAKGFPPLPVPQDERVGQMDAAWDSASQIHAAGPSGLPITPVSTVSQQTSPLSALTRFVGHYLTGLETPSGLLGTAQTNAETRATGPRPRSHTWETTGSAEALPHVGEPLVAAGGAALAAGGTTWSAHAPAGPQLWRPASTTTATTTPATATSTTTPRRHSSETVSLTWIHASPPTSRADRTVSTGEEDQRKGPFTGAQLARSLPAGSQPTSQTGFRSLPADDAASPSTSMGATPGEKRTARQRVRYARRSALRLAKYLSDGGYFEQRSFRPITPPERSSSSTEATPEASPQREVPPLVYPLARRASAVSSGALPRTGGLGGSTPKDLHSTDDSSSFFRVPPTDCGDVPAGSTSGSPAALRHPIGETAESAVPVAGSHSSLTVTSASRTDAVETTDATSGSVAVTEVVAGTSGTTGVPGVPQPFKRRWKASRLLTFESPSGTTTESPLQSLLEELRASRERARAATQPKGPDAPQSSDK